MTEPMPSADFARPSPAMHGTVTGGLSAGIDGVAERGAPSHRFLRHRWYAAAIAAYGGTARTLTVVQDGHAVLAMPLTTRRFGIAEVPGSYWPFRSFPVGPEASDAVFGAALAALADTTWAVRIGPVYDGDVAVAPLIAAARARGWAALDRFVAGSWLLDMAAAGRDGAWPRGSTLRKNRFHEKHLAAHGALDWRFVVGADWPDAFASLGAVEAASWIASRTDGRDAKFTQSGHLAFWRAAAADPVLASMFHAALLSVDGKPAAFSFDIDAGAVKYAVANSYDPAFAKHSPGKLLYYRNLVEAMARGVTLVDWGAGDSGYKQVIGADKGPAIRDWLLIRPGVPAMLGRMLTGSWRRSGQSPAPVDPGERDPG